MSNLTTLQNKDPKEVVRLLSAVSSSLLPNPYNDDSIYSTESNSELIDAVINEIRNQLRIPEDDYSIPTKSKIFAYLSEEISKAVLANVNTRDIRNRLASKGQLHPSQYQVRFSQIFQLNEALGIRKDYVTSAVINPDNVTNLSAKFVINEISPHVTISTKYVNTKKLEDRFILIIVSNREGSFQDVVLAFRFYLSEFNSDEIAEPINLLKEFVGIYGLRFRFFSDTVFKFILNEVLEVPRIHNANITDHMRLVEGQKGDPYLPAIIGAGSAITGIKENTKISEVTLGFVIDINKYASVLRKHNVNLTSPSDWLFPRI